MKDEQGNWPADKSFRQRVTDNSFHQRTKLSALQSPTDVGAKLNLAPGGWGVGAADYVTLRNFSDHVLTAERVLHSHPAFRIVLPLAVHDQSIVMFSRGELDGGTPQIALPPLHRDRVLLPIGEIADEQDARRIVSRIVEGLPFGRFH